MSLRRPLPLLVLLGSLFLGAGAAGAETTYVVRKGDTLGSIARRFKVGPKSLARANHLREKALLKLGQKLAIPAREAPKPDKGKGDAGRGGKGAGKADPGARNDGDRSEEEAQPKVKEHQVNLLELGQHPKAWFYTPTGKGHRGMKPVLVYLHGRGNNPKEDCIKWAPIARPYGWLLCPGAPHAFGAGYSWKNDVATGQAIARHALQALRKRFPNRVQANHNVLMGFSEGALVAQNVGPRSPDIFDRWFIMAASNRYWGTEGLAAVKNSARQVRGVYLLTGELDEVIEETRAVEEHLRRTGVKMTARYVPDMGHALPVDHRPAMYRRALDWLFHAAASPRTKRG